MKKLFFLCFMVVFYGSHSFVQSSTIDSIAGLIAYYPFNGNVNDESGNGNDGINYNSVPSTDRFGEIESAFEFQFNQHIEIQNIPYFDSIKTVSCWIYNTYVGSDNYIKYIFSKINGNYFPAIGFNPNKKEVQYFFDGADAELKVEIDTNMWYHIVITADNNSAKLFLT